MNTSERLKFIREKTGLSQSKFADTLEVKASLINHIEGGRQEISVDLAKKMRDRFNINFEWILLGESTTTEEPAPIKPKIIEIDPREIDKIIIKYKE